MTVGSLPPPSSRAGGRAGMEGKDMGVIETLRREISCLRHTTGEWDFAALWRLCIESPSQPKLASREALIKSLFVFILEFLCNARNGLTRIASYLRKPMTKQCIKILIKENSMN